MGRELRIAHKRINIELGSTWWGYLLNPIPCQDCDGLEAGSDLKYEEYCITCEGEGRVWPKVTPKAWPVDKAPSFYYKDGEINERYVDGEYGYQLWQTVSEGGPVSPVFDTREELARWLSEDGNDRGITTGTTFEQWMRFLDAGWAPSMMSSPSTGLISGVEAVADGTLLGTRTGRLPREDEDDE